MPDKGYGDFRAQYEQRFDDFVQWAIENWPDKRLGPSPSNFERCRVEAKAVLGRLSRNNSSSSAEPAEGGPQYVSVTPAPWS